MTAHVVLRWHGDKAVAAVREGGREGIREAAEAILDHANASVPYDTGQLMGTGEVAMEGDGVAISYDTAYAVALHAHPEWDFQGAGEARWLEKGIDEVAAFDMISGAVARRLKSSLPR